MNNELFGEKIIDGKKVKTFDIGVFEDVLETGAKALQEALNILKKVKTPEAKAWVDKYGKFAK